MVVRYCLKPVIKLAFFEDVIACAIGRPSSEEILRLSLMGIELSPERLVIYRLQIIQNN